MVLLHCRRRGSRLHRCCWAHMIVGWEQPLRAAMSAAPGCDGIVAGAALAPFGAHGTAPHVACDAPVPCPV